MKTQFVDKGIPVVIGEYGAIVNPKGLTGKEKEANLASRAFISTNVCRSSAKSVDLSPSFGIRVNSLTAIQVT